MIEVSGYFNLAGGTPEGGRWSVFCLPCLFCDYESSAPPGFPDHHLPMILADGGPESLAAPTMQANGGRHIGGRLNGGRRSVLLPQTPTSTPTHMGMPCAPKMRGIAEVQPQEQSPA